MAKKKAERVGGEVVVIAGASEAPAEVEKTYLTAFRGDRVGRMRPAFTLSA